MRIGQHYYTWCSKEEGCENLNGFQTRAKSPIITLEIETVIKRHCSRYELPRSLKDLTTRSDLLSPKDLARCPVIYQVYRVSDRLVGLTRTCLSPDQSGRGGNFFAHTFVVPADASGAEFCNPFALARSGIFLDMVDRLIPRNLDDLAEFPLPETERDPNLALARAFSKELESSLIEKMLNCLVTASDSQSRPLVLCVENPLLANSLIEAVYLLLPPGFRRALEISTYEPDPYRLWNRTRSVSSPELSLVGTIPASEGGQFQFRDDEYLTRFNVFNLCTGKESATGTLDGYVRHVGEAVRKKDWMAIVRAQEIIDRLEVTDRPALWAGILPATRLLADELRAASHREWESVLAALGATFKSPGSVKAAYDFVWEHTRELLPSLPEDIAIGLIAFQKELLQNHRDEMSGNIEEKSNTIVRTFADLIRTGRFHLALSLIGLPGVEPLLRQRLIRQGVCTAMDAEKSKWPGCEKLRIHEEAEVTAYADILSEVVTLLNQDSKQCAMMAELLQTGLETLQKSELGFERAWGRISPKLVPEVLDQLPKESLPSFLVSFDRILSDARKTDDQIRVLLWQLGVRLDELRKQPETFFAALENVCQKCREPERTVKEIISQARLNLEGKDDGFLASICAFLTRTVPISSRETVLSAYLDIIAKNAENGGEWKVRSGLATTPDGLKLLAIEFWSRVIPWKTSLARQWICPWVRHLAKPDRKTGKTLAAAIAAQACHYPDASTTCAVMLACLEQFHAEGLREETINAVFVDAIINLSSLAALSEPVIWRVIAAVDKKGLSSSSQASIEMIQYMAKARRLPDSKSPSLPPLVEDSCFRKTLELLPEKQWNEVAAWLISGLLGPEIENEKAVAAIFVLLLNPESVQKGQPAAVDKKREDAAGIIILHLRSELLAGRFREDPTTRVCFLCSFVTLLRLYTASGSPSYDSSTPTIFGTVARILGAVLAEDRRLVGRLLWVRLKTHLPEDQAWIARFKDQVQRVMQEQKRSRRPLELAVASLRGLLSGVCPVGKKEAGLFG